MNKLKYLVVALAIFSLLLGIVFSQIALNIENTNTPPIDNTNELPPELQWVETERLYEGFKYTIGSPYETEKECSYLIGQTGTYTYMINGTTGRMVYYSTNVTKVEQFALGNMTTGQLYLKEIPHNTSLTLTATQNIFEQYQGVFKYWNSTGSYQFGISAMGSTGPAGTVYGLPFSYFIFKNATATYMVNGATSIIDYYSTNNSKVFDFALGNGTGIVFAQAATYSFDSGFTMGKQDKLIGAGHAVTIFDVTANIAQGALILVANENVTADTQICDIGIDMNSFNGDAIQAPYMSEGGGLCEQKIDGLLIEAVKVGYCGMNLTNIFNTRIGNIRIRTSGYGIKIANTGSIDWGNCQFDNIRIGLQADNAYGLYIMDGTTRSCNLAVFNNLEVMGGGHANTGAYINDNKITFVGGTLEGSETTLLEMEDASYCNFYNMHIGSTDSTGTGVWLHGASFSNTFSGGWIYTAAGGTVWNDDSTTNVRKNLISDGTYLGVGTKDLGTNTLLASNVWVFKTGSTVAKATNTVTALQVKNGDTVNHLLYTNPKVILITCNVAAVVWPTGNTTSTITFGAQWLNGTVAGVGTEIPIVYVWCSVSGD